MTAGFTESIVEQAALAWLESVGWQVRNGAEIAPGESAAERDDYQNRAIEAAQVIEELIALAKEIEAGARGTSLRLSEDELAFYDAVETNDKRREGPGR